jgi:enoyl-CoA hydratase/carnithine racemase
MLEDDRAIDRLQLDTPERENAWVKEFIGRLSDVLRNVIKPQVRAAHALRP